MVPMPIVARSPQTALNSESARMASGVVKVNSITVMPFSIKTLTMLGRSATDGARNTATSRDCAMLCGSGMRSGTGQEPIVVTRRMVDGSTSISGRSVTPCPGAADGVMRPSAIVG